MRPRLQKCVSKNGWILLANSNQWHFNNLVKKPCHETHCRCPHRLHLSFQSSRSCALPSIKVLKDKDLEFANSIPAFIDYGGCGQWHVWPPPRAPDDVLPLQSSNLRATCLRGFTGCDTKSHE